MTRKMCLLTATLDYATWQEFIACYYAAEWLKQFNSKSSGLVTFHVLHSVLYLCRLPSSTAATEPSAQALIWITSDTEV